MVKRFPWLINNDYENNFNLARSLIMKFIFGRFVSWSLNSISFSPNLLHSIYLLLHTYAQYLVSININWRTEQWKLLTCFVKYKTKHVTFANSCRNYRRTCHEHFIMISEPKPLLITQLPRDAHYPSLARQQCKATFWAKLNIFRE